MEPLIIQGGMGAGVSNWRLANAVSRQGQLGVISGTAMDQILVRRLEDGDPGGHCRRALEAFPIPGVAAELLDRFFRPEGRAEGEPYTSLSLLSRTLTPLQQKLLVASNFVEVFLAREGHENPVGINLLTKIQIPNLPSLYGAMLAGVAVVLMGAGIPREIPGSLDRLARHESATIRLDVVGGSGADDETLTFDPAVVWGKTPTPGPLERPRFLPIIASNSLATMMVRKANGRVDGFVVEGPTAGGHNAPPRGKPEFNERGEPLYGPRDEVDLGKLAALGLPFWVAGGAGSPRGLREAREAGAAGIQVGTLFAFCVEAGLTAEVRDEVVRRAVCGELDVLTDGRASPTGFPFKAVALAGTASEEDVYEARSRICDLGYLRVAYRREDGALRYRCPSEPVETYVKKGGSREDTVGRKCLCNALMANIGHAQVREKTGYVEPMLLTSGDELRNLGRFLEGRTSYSARDVIEFLLSDPAGDGMAVGAGMDSASV
ncbi:MAG: nitronate monooxygenase [Gemmatimonadota bacterium]